MNIGEVSRKYGISPDTLRYYEKIGIIPPVPRKGGIRDYDEASLGWVELMICMRSAGIQIEALIEYVQLYQQGEATLEKRRDLLVRQRSQLEKKIAQMQASLEKLNFKIEHYDQNILNPERGLKAGQKDS